MIKLQKIINYHKKIAILESSIISLQQCNQSTFDLKLLILELKKKIIKTMNETKEIP